jgi:tetratricopeptide (TPR) repeat protein
MSVSTTKTTFPSPADITNQDMAAVVAAGTDCLENGDLRGALQVFEQVVDAFPERPEGHNNLGALYNSMGEYQRAEACFSRVIEILPENPAIYYNRGMARSSQEKYDTARADFLKVLEFDSRDADCLNNLGVMDFMQGKFPAAKLRFRQALELVPDNTRALLNLCDVEMAEGHTAVAIDLCEEFLRTRNSIEVRRALLEMLSTGCQKTLDKAGRTAETLLASGSTDPEISRQLQRIQKAKAMLEETAEI